MTPQEIDGLVAPGESETLELKRTTRLRQEGAQAVCAMLNHRGGYVLYGVEPDGKIVGQQVSDHTIEEVAQELGRIDPPAMTSIRIDPIDLGNGQSVIAVAVQSGHHQPYSYRGSAYRRVGNTNQVMTRDEYNRILLERLHNEQRWENRYAEGWSADDLDQAEIRRTIKEAVRRGRLDDPGSDDPDDLLRGLGLLREGRLLRAAPVLFGQPERMESEMPQCRLRVARFRGSDRAEFHDNRQFYGNAFTLLRQAERFLRDSLPVAGRIVPDALERIDEPLYPPEAWREALANAFCHRDYSIGGGSVGVAIYDDRLEITSSGSLPFGLTPEQLFRPHESRPWNPLLARVFYRRGFIEEWGRGTLKMAELLAAAGLPPPEIEDAAGSVAVRFRPGRYAPPQRVTIDLTERQQTILSLLNRAPGGLTLGEILGFLDPPQPEPSVIDDLAMLRTLKLAVSFGQGRGARWQLS